MELIKIVFCPDPNERPRFIKEISKTQFDGKFQKYCEKVENSCISLVKNIAKPKLVKASFLVPPIFFGLFFGMIGSLFVGVGSKIAKKIKNVVEEKTNKEFNDQNPVEEEEIIQEIYEDLNRE